jgi:cell division protein FtsB
VRATELITEALVTQGAARKSRKPPAEPSGREILAAITNLADNYHGVHSELTTIREMLVEQAERRQRDWEELHRRMEGLRDLIDRRQRDNDSRADRLAAEIDELRARADRLAAEIDELRSGVTLPDAVRAKLLELEMLLKDHTARIDTIEPQLAELLRRSTLLAAAQETA